MKKITQGFQSLLLLAFLFIQNNSFSQTKNQATANNTVWKATLSYCLSRERNDSYTFRYYGEDGLELENSSIYNYSTLNQSGSLKNVLGSIYDSISRGVIYKFPQNGLDSTHYGHDNSLNILYLSYFFENKFEKGNKILVDTSGIGKQNVNGIVLNREWMYDAKEHKLLTKCTDAAIFYPIGSAYLQIYGNMLFLKRADASSGLNQKVCKPEIVWCRNMALPLVNERDSSKLFVYKTYAKGDTIAKYPFQMLYGVPHIAFSGFNTIVKTTFEKPLVNWIWDEARNGALECFANDSGKIGKRLTKDEVMNAGSRIDTAVEEDGGYIIIKVLVDPQNLDGLEIKEELSFNKKTFRFESKIKYAALILKDVSSNTGKFEGDHELLYWVKFKD